MSGKIEEETKNINIYFLCCHKRILQKYWHRVFRANDFSHFPQIILQTYEKNLLTLSNQGFLLCYFSNMDTKLFCSWIQLIAHTRLLSFIFARIGFLNFVAAILITHEPIWIVAVAKFELRLRITAEIFLSVLLRPPLSYDC